MSDVVWKKFILSELFKRNTPPSTNVAAKNLHIKDEPFENSIALITRAETNNGIRGYIEKGDFPTLKNAITYNDQFSFFLYHNYEFTTIKDHLSVITAIDEEFKNILESFSFVDIFITTILNHVFSKKIFSFNYSGADFKFDREIILLPCLEVNESDEHIWEEDGHYYTLATDYIKKLMDEAKELREQKTIRLYEAERSKYEAERSKYEAEYKKKKPFIVWKSFKLDSLFERSTKLALGINQKDLKISKQRDEDYSIALISASRNGNGCVGYLKASVCDSKKISVNKITFDDQWGYTYFQQEKFVITGGHNAILEIIDNNLKILLDNNLICYSFLSLLLNVIGIKTKIYGYGYKINNKFDREIILLPCLEVNESDEHIWEEDGHYYTLAVNYISYIYLTGRIEHYQKLIDKYSYPY